MRSILIACFSIFLFFSSCQTEENGAGFTLSVEIAGSAGQKVFLRDFQWNLLDSAILDQGMVEFEGQVAHPYLAYLIVEGRERQRAGIFLENSRISFSSNVDSLPDGDISGSESHDLYQDFLIAQARLDMKFRELYNAYNMAEEAADTIAMESIDQQWEDAEEEFETWESVFVQNNPASTVSAHLIYSDLKYKIELEELKTLTQSLSPEIGDSEYLVLLNKRIAILDKTAPGQPMIDFVQNDSSGNSLGTQEFRGKYLLVDFWASWCGPCRRENPNVVAMYHELKDQGVGFEILGVSFDTDRQKWIQAIHDDQLTWPQVSDLKGWDNAVGKEYGIEGIPHTLLVDPDGVIIAHKLRGEDLREKLQELLGSES